MATTTKAFGYWVRSCPICKVVLSKTNPGSSVVCACGWHWEA